MSRLFLFLLPALLVGCGASAADYLTPVWEATVEGCYQRQRRAVLSSQDREEAEIRVVRIRERCDQAYTGLRAAGWVLETALPEDEE